MAKVVAIGVADLHLSDQPPLARSGEPDWYDAMERQLSELAELANKYDVPVLCAGDVFDRWNVPPRLISFALTYLPEPFYTVFGNHDLPNHSWERRYESALGTLWAAGTVGLLPQTSLRDFDHMVVQGFHFQHSPGSCSDHRLSIAVVHDYCWNAATGYPGAPQDRHIRHWPKLYEGFDVVIVGDNHHSFEHRNIWNVGGFFRRSIDERDHRPSVLLIHDDASVQRHYLDVSQDVFEEREPVAPTKGEQPEIQEFLKQLEGLEVEKLDFLDAVRKFCRQELRVEMRRVLLDLIGEQDVRG